MAERLAALRALPDQAKAAFARAAPHAQRAWATTRLWSARAWDATKTGARVSLRVSRRVLNVTLRAVESTLLDARGRERVHATAVFTLIFAFLVTSADFLLTGGPELDFGAEAAEHVTYYSPIAPTMNAAGLVEMQAAEGAPAPEPIQVAEVVTLEAPLPHAELADAPLADAPIKAEGADAESPTARLKAKPETA